MSKQIWAWALIALMVLTGTTNAKALVWCSDSNGHSAIEMCLGVQCHASLKRAGAAGDPEHQHLAIADSASHDSDCVDIPALPDNRQWQSANANPLPQSIGDDLDEGHGSQLAHLWGGPRSPELRLGPGVSTRLDRTPGDAPNALAIWHRITVLRI